MTNKLIELNKKEIGAISGGQPSLKSTIEDTLCASSIYGAAVTATGLVCPLLLSKEICAGVFAVMQGAAFIAIPIIGTISEYMHTGTKNETVTAQQKKII